MMIMIKYFKINNILSIKNILNNNKVVFNNKQNFIYLILIKNTLLNQLMTNINMIILINLDGNLQQIDHNKRIKEIVILPMLCFINLPKHY